MPLEVIPPIPTDRPVLGKDLETLRARLDCTSLECCALLGIPLTTWSTWKNREDEPIPNPTAALTLRLYDRFPELVPTNPTPEELRVLLVQVTGRKIPVSELSLLLGREKTSGHRWRERGAPSVPVSRLMGILQRLLETKYLSGFVEYRTLLEREAAARGIPNLLEAGSWTNVEKQ
jgi:hypothetical protein